MELNPQRWEKFYFPDLYLKLKFKLKKQEGVAEINEGSERSVHLDCICLEIVWVLSGRRESRNLDKS